MSEASSPNGPRTIQVPVNGTGTVSATLPPGVSLDVQTVYVEIDATAAGVTTAELVLSEQSGVVIARKRQSETVDAGINGSATWALRLDDSAASSNVVNASNARAYGFLQFQVNRPGAPVTVQIENFQTIIGTKANGVTTRNVYALNFTTRVAANDFLTFTYKNGSGATRSVQLRQLQVQDTTATAIEVAHDAAATRNVANLATDPVGFAHFSGPALLNYATPDKPSFVAGGLYTVAVSYLIDFWT